MEYILLLVISVGLIMGASKAFKGLNSFMDSYIGDYTICLMEYGELPTLGVQEISQKTHVGAPGCDQKFASFTLSSGRPPTGGSGLGSRGGGGGKSGTGGSNKNSSSSANKASNEDDSNADDGSGKRRGPRSSGGASAYAKGQINRSNDLGTADGPSGAGNKKSKILEEDEGEENRRRRGSNSNTSAFAKSRVKYKAIRGALAEEIKKRSPKLPREPARTIVAVSSQTGNKFGPYKKTFTPPEPKKIEVSQDDGSGFSFGNILRWLIIGGMIIALIVFFGGQIMNYSNSQD